MPVGRDKLGGHTRAGKGKKVSPFEDTEKFCVRLVTNIDRFVIITDLVILLKSDLVKSFEMKTIKVLFNRSKQLM